MQPRLTRVLFIICAIGSFSQSAKAGPVPILLAGFYSGGGAGLFNPSGSIPPLTGFAEGLSYNPPRSGNPPQGCLGCDFVWSIGQTGQVDLNITNSPNWADLISHLTNGIDEIIYSSHGQFSGTTLISPGWGAGGSMESGAFTATPDLMGRNIDFIRHIMLGSIATISPNSYEFEYQAKWEIWGTGTPLPSPIPPPPLPTPEPPSLVLLGLACAGVIAANWQLCRQSKRGTECSQAHSQ